MVAAMSASAPSPLARPRVVSGVQPSGVLHLGNFFGAIQQHLALQESFPGEALYFIADYHALTTVHEAAALREHTREVAIAYLALGLDPAKALLFRQSDVPEVLELAWMLSCVSGMGLLERGHSYKDKVAQGLRPSVGLFYYPVLMAADILLYSASVVPVGRDQLQHIEFAQDMATHFNQAFAGGAAALTRPEPRLSQAPIVPGLDGRKMSKSYGNTIPIWESGKKLRKLTGQIVTDSTPLGEPLPNERCNVYALLQLCCEAAEMEQVKQWYQAGRREGQPFGYGHAKVLLAERLERLFAPARARREALLAEPGAVEAVLMRSAEQARVIARATIRRCREVCGLP
jgi:tryptophanyl-tRNA synthetase